MTEIWKDIPGFAGRYQVSNLGRIKSLSFKQRYIHWRTGVELFRQTKERILATQILNSGYKISHLHLDNLRRAVLVHRVVAEVFLPMSEKPEVNHINGIKTDNRADNLEFVTSLENKMHALCSGRNPQAVAVKCPTTGDEFPSIAHAARILKKSPRTIRKHFHKEGPTCRV